MARPSRDRASGNGQAQEEDQNGNANNRQNGNQPQRPVRHISGPQSALTDYLASHNISARRIREEAEQRRQQAAASARPNGVSNDGNEDDAFAPATGTSSSGRRGSARGSNSTPQTAKQKETAKAIEKIKTTKAFKKRKKDARDSDDDDDDAIARAIFEERHAPLPGQMENCELCSRRFTVTPYSVAGPQGSLCCATCGREIAKQRQGQQPKKKPRKQTGGVGSRRTVQSRILDGDRGTKSLSTLCVQTLAKNVDMADSLGDLPEHLVDKIARAFSKRRLLRSETLPLFVQPSTEVLRIYDGARLGEQDFIRIFQVSSKLKSFKARSAIQFKDEVMDYLLTRTIDLEQFYLHGANLLREDKWHAFFNERGSNLRALQVYYTDLHFGDETIALLQHTSPQLNRLKIENNQKVTDVGVEAAGDLPKLEHLGFQLRNDIHSPAVVKALEKCGSRLRTLSLKVVPLLDDSVLECIHNHCRSLSKLRITDSEHMTDQGFANLFKGWENPALEFVDLQKCRHLDSTQPRNNPDRVGLCDQGFKALMAHSGSRIRVLNIHGCRHISQQAFEEVFAEGAVFPELVDLEISFCENVNDFVLGSIFRSCPVVKKVNVFGCMKVREVRVPRGTILIGVPNAQGMVMEGAA